MHDEVNKYMKDLVSHYHVRSDIFFVKSLRCEWCTCFGSTSNEHKRDDRQII